MAKEKVNGQGTLLEEEPPQEEVRQNREPDLERPWELGLHVPGPSDAIERRGNAEEHVAAPESPKRTLAVEVKPTMRERVVEFVHDVRERASSLLPSRKEKSPVVTEQQVNNSAAVLGEIGVKPWKEARIAEIKMHPAVTSNFQARWIEFKADVRSRFSIDLTQRDQRPAQEAARQASIEKSLEAASDERVAKLQGELAKINERLKPLRNQNITAENAHLHLTGPQRRDYLRVGDIGDELRVLSPDSQKVAEIHQRWRGAAPSVSQRAAVAESLGGSGANTGHRAESPRVQQGAYTRALEALTQHDKAISVDKFPPPAAKNMREQLYDQLRKGANEELAGRTPDKIDLTWNYRGTGDFNKAHTEAAAMNDDAIKLVRQYITEDGKVDVGKAVVASPQKKSEQLSQMEATGINA